MSKRRRKSKRKGSNGTSNGRARVVSTPLDMAPDPSNVALAAATEWLRRGTHREGCQCHRCYWATRVMRGLVVVTFDVWKAEKPK